MPRRLRKAEPSDKTQPKTSVQLSAATERIIEQMREALTSEFGPHLACGEGYGWIVRCASGHTLDICLKRLGAPLEVAQVLVFDFDQPGGHVIELFARSDAEIAAVVERIRVLR